jgi:ERCC4-type nuclease
VCEKEAGSEKDFVKHLRSHKVRVADYFNTYCPKYDLSTGDPIVFKSLKQYLNTDFNLRSSMIQWILHEAETAQARSYAKELVRRRVEEKGLKYAPSTVEARTSMLPAVVCFDMLGLDYNSVCKDLSLRTKYDYNQRLEFVSAPKDFRILIDSREQNAIKFECQQVISKLDFGDYTCGNDGIFKNIFIERKDVHDFMSSFTKSIDRLKSEFNRAKELEASIVVLCEYPLNKLLNIEGNPELNKYTSITSEYLFHNVKEICQEYQDVQFLFVNDRIEAQRAIEKILLMKNNIRTVDLQYQFDNRKLL